MLHANVVFSRARLRMSNPVTSHVRRARRLSVTTIVADLAEREAQRIVVRAIRSLQRSRDTLSGDDSGLLTTWEEICVQVQGEHSVYWSTYAQVIEALVGADVAELKPYVREAIWLQTQDGWDWDCEEEHERSDMPVDDSVITEYLVTMVLSAADDWSNARIRTYKNRQYEVD